MKLDCHVPASSGLNEEQLAIQQMATDFATNELKPYMSKWDQEARNAYFTLPGQYN